MNFHAILGKKIKEFLSQTGHADESKSNLFLIQVPTESCKGDVLRIYLNSESTDRQDVKQRLKIHLLQKERDRLIEINKKTNKNLTKNQQMIDILHQYNEIKDIAQKLMGTMNEIKGTTTKELYESFGLNLTD
eukprot:567335_1